MNNKNETNRRYKDTVFRMLFSNREYLLQLYNAVNNTDYDNPDDLTITTLENAVYMSMKNDLSCLIDMRLALFEHQSTVNPNMPLRDLYYVADTYSKLHSDRDAYSPKLIKLPNPRFVVFYNGEVEQPAIREMKLSDAYVHHDIEPQLELIVTQININQGYNDELFERSPLLGEYMMFVNKVRTYQRQIQFEDAVKKAVDECIEEGILADFLRENKAEVIKMSIYEYDEKLHEKTMLEIGREEGREEGKEEGREEGREDTKRSVAEEMIIHNETDEYIAQITKLSVEEVAGLRSKLQLHC